MQGEDIMEFAGCWKDMSDEDFQDFLADIQYRRHIKSMFLIKKEDNP